MLKDFLAAGPRSLSLMLTTRCNLRCAYCLQDRRRPRSMGIDVLDTAVRRLLRSDCPNPSLTFFGGEPLLEMALVRRAVEIVRAERPCGMSPDLRLFTNGLLLDQHAIRDLADADVHVTMSFDGLPGSQDQRGRGTFEILDRTLWRLGRESPEPFLERVSIAITLTSGNVRNLAASYRYFRSLGVRRVGIAPVVGRDPGWNGAARDELDRQLGRVADEFRRSRATEDGDVPFGPWRGDGRQRSTQAAGTRLCGAASRTELFVDVDGSLAPCAAIAPSCLANPPPLLREALESFGDLHVDDPDLEAKLRAREERIQTIPMFVGKEDKTSVAGLCRDCPAFQVCVVCPASIAWNDGPPDPRRIPPIQCDFNRLVEKHRRSLDPGRAS